VGEQPLPVAPSVIVLRVCLEYLFVECQFWHGVAQNREEKPSVVPDLVCLRGGLSERVGEDELGLERGGYGDECFIAVLPSIP